MNDTFPHREYHLYTTNSSLNKRHVHLTEDILTEAAELLDVPEEQPVEGNWNWTMRQEVASGIFLTVRPGSSRYPRLESPGYEGWEPTDDGKLEEEVWFDGMIFHKCIGKRDRDPEWDYEDLLDSFVLDDPR